jgi:UPF0716 protein FxsA
VRLVLFLAFAVVPAVELALLIWLGQILGVWPTLGIILVTAAVGAAIARREGLATVLRAHRRLEAGQLPVEELQAGVAIAAGGLLLLTPGYLTDLLGLALLLPPSRWLIIRLVRGLVRGRVQTTSSDDGIIDLSPEDYEVR